MNMAADKRKKEEKEATQEIKHQHANYKWLKYMFARQDELEARLSELEKTVKFIKEEIQKIKEGEQKRTA